MTIEERIERFNMALSLSMEEGAAEAAKNQLHELLEQVAKEQREEIFEEIWVEINLASTETDAAWRVYEWYKENAPSPLNEDSHE